MSTPIELAKFEDSAAGQAILALNEADSVFTDFTEFTTELVRNVIETVVKASMDQLEAYADLVAVVSGTMADYEQRTFPDLEGEVLKYINTHIKPSYGGESWTEDATSDGVEAVALASEKIGEFKALFSGVFANFEAHGVPGVADYVIEDVIVEEVNQDSTSYTIIPADLFHLAKAKFQREIKMSYDKLVTILKLGMQKIVFTEGLIATSISFKVSSRDFAKVTSTDRKEYTVTNSLGWAKGTLSWRLKEAAFNTGSLTGSRSTNKIEVKTFDVEQSASTNIDATITGKVELRFRSETFPTFDATAALPAVP